MAQSILSRLTSDPPPRFVFELSEAGVAVARAGSPPQIVFQPLPPATIAVSPVRDNVLDMEAFSRVVTDFAPKNEKKRQRAVLILPDFSVRVSVLDFDSFPSEPEQQRPLVRFRIKKSLPFDVESATLAYYAQPNGRKWDVVVAVAPVEILARYEAPFRAAGFHLGMVTTSALAALELIRGDGVSVLAKLSGRTLTLAVVDATGLKLHRTLELASEEPEEVISHLFPTFAYAEDQLKARPQRVLVCGFGGRTKDIWSEVERELQVQAEPLRSRYGSPDQYNAGLMGYLESAEEFQ